MNYTLKTPNGPERDCTLDDIRKELSVGKISSEYTVRKNDSQQWQTVRQLLESTGTNANDGAASPDVSAKNAVTKAGQFAGWGFAIGAVIGYPLSYYFQPAALRAKLSLGAYIEHVSEVLGSNDLRITAIGTWVVAIVGGILIGFAVGRNADQKR